MQNDKLVSRSIEETNKIGQIIGHSLRGGEIIFLSGILGAGKTVLVKGIAKGLGVKGKITSPTFNIMRVYNTPQGGKLYHFDCYRLKKYSDLADLGWEEIISEKNAVVILEWPECIVDKDIKKLFDKDVIKIKIKIEGNKRRINLEK